MFPIMSGPSVATDLTWSNEVALHCREVMKSPRLSLSFFLRALVTIFCAGMAIYQVSSSINTYLEKPTTTTMEKGSIRSAEWNARRRIGEILDNLFMAMAQVVRSGKMGSGERG